MSFDVDGQRICAYQEKEHDMKQTRELNKRGMNEVKGGDPGSVIIVVAIAVIVIRLTAMPSPGLTRPVAKAVRTT